MATARNDVHHCVPGMPLNRVSSTVPEIRHMKQAVAKTLIETLISNNRVNGLDVTHTDNEALRPRSGNKL